MRIHEFNDMANKIKKDMWAEYEQAKEKWEQKEEINIHLIQRKIKSAFFQDMTTPHDMIDAMNEFLLDINDLPFHQNGRMEISMSTESNGDYSEIDDNNYEYTYNVLGDQGYMEAVIKDKIRVEFGTLLKPDNYMMRAVFVPCKLMELYLDETIDFETLQDIVYGDCDI